MWRAVTTKSGAAIIDGEIVIAYVQCRDNYMPSAAKLFPTADQAAEYAATIAAAPTLLAACRSYLRWVEEGCAMGADRGRLTKEIEAAVKAATTE